MPQGLRNTPSTFKILMKMFMGHMNLKLGKIPCHIVSERGVETDPEKVEVLKTWTIPSNLIELQSFLRFAGYYQRFIHGYTIIARALNELASSLSPLRKLNNKPRTIANSDYNNQREPFGH